MSREGLVLVALAWEIDRPPAYETATAATVRGDLELSRFDAACKVDYGLRSRIRVRSHATLRAGSRRRGRL
jgi:hypothetical protein